MSLLFVVGLLFQSLSSLILQDQLNSAPHHPSHCSAASTCKLYARPTLQTEHLILSMVSGEKLRQRSQYSSIKPQRDCQNCLDYANKISLCCPQYRTLELFKHACSITINGGNLAVNQIMLWYGFLQMTSQLTS